MPLSIRRSATGVIASNLVEMRTIVLSVGVTLDGYIARPDGAVDYLFMPKDFSMAPFFASVDTAVAHRTNAAQTAATRKLP